MPFHDIYNKCYLGTFFAFALIETLVCSGITYGWASIVVVFKLEHFYLRLCKPFYKEHNITFPTDTHYIYNQSVVGGSYFKNSKLPGCPAQDSIFNLIFTISIFCLSGIKFPTGVFIDRCGPRVARSVGGVLYIGAALGLGFVTIGYEDFLFPVFICICMGGSLLVISVYQVCNVIYRNTKSQVICILHGGFDSSAVILLIFKVMFENGINMKYISLMYACLCLILILIGTFVLIPSKDVLFYWINEERRMGYDDFNDSIAGPDFAVNSMTLYKESTASKHSAYESCASSLEKESINEKLSKSSLEDLQPEFHMHPKKMLDDKKEVEKLISDEHTPLLSKSQSVEKSSVFPKGSVLRSIFSSLYLMELVFLATFQLKLWYFVGSLPDYLGRLSHNNKETVSDYINMFGYIQFGGIFVTPLIGVIFDRDSFFGKNKMIMTVEEKRLKKLKQCIAPFTITIVLCIIFSILALFEDIRFQIPEYALYTTVRGFVYANHGSFMAVAFPPDQFGTLYGLGIFTAGCVGLFEYALFELTSGPFHGEPYYTNVILLILVLFSLMHPINVWRYCRKEEKRRSQKPSLQTNNI